VPPLKGRELVADDIKYCYEAYAQEGVQAFTFQEIDGMETPDKYTIRIHLKTPNTMFPQNVAEAVTTIFPREVLEEDGDLKSRMIGTGPFILKENQRKVKVVLTRNPDYFDKGFRTSTSTVSCRRQMRRRAWRPSAPGRAMLWCCKALPMSKRYGRRIPRRWCKRSSRPYVHLALICVQINHPSTMCGYVGLYPWRSTGKSKSTPL
jgi:hypothetical protein